MSSYFQTGFRDKDFHPLTVLAMTLGEMNYIDIFVESNNFPFTIDSYILCGIFMLMMPIALVNLLVSIFNLEFFSGLFDHLIDVLMLNSLNGMVQMLSIQSYQ